MTSPPQSVKDVPHHEEAFHVLESNTSVKSQLSHWHATKGREHRSFLRNLIPSFQWKTQKNSPNEVVVHNPIKLIMSVPLKGWIMFIVGSFAWVVSRRGWVGCAVLTISAMVSTTSPCRLR